MGITIDITKVFDSSYLANKKDQILDACAKGMTKGMQYFSAKMVIEQMSGRSNVSLGRVSKHLAENWLVKTYETGFGGRDVITTLQNRLAPYAIIHQLGSADWDGTYPGNVTNKSAWRAMQPKREKGAPRRHNIPKRLHVIEDFVQSAPAILADAIITEVVKVK
jgi:hypothetical protein